MGATTIEWTDDVWNVTRGCRRVSPGCENCYAETTANRFSGPGQAYDGLITLGKSGPRWNGKVKFVEEKLLEPLHWVKPKRVFVNSMSDLFYEGFSDEEIDRVFAVMANAPRHTFQILTKRAERMERYFEWQGPYAMNVRGAAFRMSLSDKFRWPLPNVHLGISAENQAEYDRRTPLLMATPASTRFLSLEPLLGPITLSLHAPVSQEAFGPVRQARDFLHWVIVGCESGRRARPMDLAWARSLRDECEDARVPFFLKQAMVEGKLAKKPSLDGCQHVDFPVSIPEPLHL